MQRFSAVSSVEGRKSHSPYILPARGPASSTPNRDAAVRMLSMVLLWNVVRMGGGMYVVLNFPSRSIRCCALLASDAVSIEQMRESVMCSCRCFVLLTTSTAVSLMRS